MLQNERSIRNRKARAEYHRKVEAVCTVAVGAAVVGATAAVVQGIFDPVVDMSMLEIEPAAFLELNNKAVELDGAETCSDEVETVEAEIVPEQEAAAPASAPKAEQPIVEATATEQPASAPADPAPVAPQSEQPAAPAPKDATPASAPAAPATPDPAVAAPTASAPADPAPAPVAPADPAPAAAPKAEQTKSKNKNANAAK